MPRYGRGSRSGFVRKMARTQSPATLKRIGRKMFAMGNTTVGKEFMRAAGGRNPYRSRSASRSGTTRRRSRR